MNNDNSNAALSLVISSLIGGEQTEAYIFAEGATRGLAVHEVNAAVALLVASGRVVETTIEMPVYPWGHGAVDALRLAA